MSRAETPPTTQPSIWREKANRECFGAESCSTMANLVGLHRRRTPSVTNYLARPKTVDSIDTCQTPCAPLPGARPKWPPKANRQPQNETKPRHRSCPSPLLREEQTG